MKLVRDSARLVAIMLLGVAFLGIIAVRTSGRPGAIAAPSAAPVQRAEVVAAAPTASFGLLTVKDVPDPEQAAREVLRDRYGVSCYAQSDVEWVPLPGAVDDLTGKANAAHLAGPGWIAEGAWLGASTDAARAFGATDVFVDSDLVWIVVPKGAQGVALHMVSLRLDDARRVWFTLDQIAPCLSEDPHYDELQSPVYPTD